jgi:methylmalonyl-CoA mutase N-terminal domain/subunit
MTDQIEEETWNLIDRIDVIGGAVAAIENGFMRREIARSAYEFQQKLEAGEEIIVGVNSFTGEEELEVVPPRLVPYPYNPTKRAQAEERQMARLNKVRRERDGQQVQGILQRIEEAAHDENTNLIPLFVEAASAYASIGEIFDVLKRVFGKATPPRDI